jgi:hypothetical protein
MPEDKKNLPAKKDRSSFLDKVRSSKAISATPKQEMLKKAIAHTERPRLLFAMDATASREACWNVAKEITGAMFEAVPGELDVALAYHSGGRLQEMTPFSSEARAFLDKVQAVRCSAGRTALNEILDQATQTPRLKALIYIGDCFEENSQEAIEIAQQLKLKGVRCFISHDSSSQAQGYDTKAALTVFEQITRITGGAILPFDETSPDLVKELLSAIALYAAQGIKALQKQTKLLPAARLLLEQMK